MEIEDGASPPPRQVVTPDQEPPGPVMLKLRDSVDVPYHDDVGSELETRGVLPWSDIRARFPGIRLRRLYTTLSPDQITDLVNRATRNDPTYEPPNFFTYFVVECPPSIAVADVAAAFRALPLVEYAYQAPRMTRQPALVTPDARLQGFHSAGPDGINAFAAWNIPGGDGAGQALVDLEAGWTLNHQDLGLVGLTEILNNTPANPAPSSPIYASHGTSVLGIIRALDNGIGCVGLAPKATVNLVSITDPATLFQDSSRIPNAIQVALSSLNFGNVLLLEAQVLDAVLNRLVPCETDVFCYQAIRLGSALGVVVIEPGGTNDVDLDAFVDIAGLHVLDMSSPQFRDSGAIVVGAASSSAPHVHLAAASAHGSRIDCYGWGENVATCDSNNAGSTTLYTNTFSGTSSASAIIAGAALLIQGMLQASTGRRFSPAQLRQILRDINNGTPVTPLAGAMATRAIPDLGTIATNVLDVAPDVYVRDFVGDTGTADGVSQALSPDIIVRAAAVGNPQVSFGEGSATEDDETLSNDIQLGQDNHVYIRVRNRGGSDAADVTVTAFWAEPSTLITPDSWNLIGSEIIANVPAGNVLTSSPPILWSQGNLPPLGHHCLVALIGNALDPMPVWASFGTFDNFAAFINRNNNVAWRNFEVVSPDGADGSGDVSLDFMMRGAFDRARPMGLEVVADLPQGAEIALEAPVQLMELWNVRAGVDEIREERATLPLRGNSCLLLPPIDLPARSKVAMKVRVRIPDSTRRGRHDVYVRQMFKDIEVGRVTWRLQRQIKT